MHEKRARVAHILIPFLKIFCLSGKILVSRKENRIVEEGKTKRKDRGGQVYASREIFVLENFLKIYKHRLLGWMYVSGWGERNSKTSPKHLHRRPDGQRSRGPLRHPAARRGIFKVAAAGWG